MPGALLLLVGSFVVASMQAGDASSGAAFLETGVRQVGEGNFEEAVFTLDNAVSRLSTEPGRSRELVQAYVYLGAAYVGLDHAESGRAKFRQALKLDPGLRLGAEQFPPKVKRLFDEEALALTAVKKKRTGRTLLILGGLGAAGAVGVSAASSKDSAPPNRPPTAAIGVSPSGHLIVAVTRVTLAASASDADGDPLTYEWDFGDGTRGSGTNATHVYGSAGTFTIRLTVSDDRGASVGASATAIVGTLSGPWYFAEQLSEFQCTQSGASLECTVTSLSEQARSADGRVIEWHGTVSHPRLIDIRLTTEIGRIQSFRCEVLPSRGSPTGLDCISCLGLTGPVRLDRGNGCG